MPAAGTAAGIPRRRAPKPKPKPTPTPGPGPGGCGKAVAAPAPTSCTLVDVPLPRGGCLQGALYAPAGPPGQGGGGGQQGADALVVCAPGSSGGCGPGLEPSNRGLPLERLGSAAALGSLYRRLGAELAGGMRQTWRGREAKDVPGAPHARTGTRRTTCRVALLQITWRHCRGGVKWPGGKLRKLEALESAVEDIEAAAAYLRARFGESLPLALVGFSFGGPSAWAAAARLVRQGAPPAAVACLAGSGRGGDRFMADGLHTRRCVEACAAAGVAALFLHGSADINVPLDVGLYYWQAHQAAVPRSVGSTLAVLAGSAHLMDLARDTAYAALAGWLCAALGARRPPWLGAQHPPPCGPGPACMMLRGGGRPAERLEPRQVLVQELQPEEVKGYSEK